MDSSVGADVRRRFSGVLALIVAGAAGFALGWGIKPMADVVAPKQTETTRREIVSSRRQVRALEMELGQLRPQLTKAVIDRDRFRTECHRAEQGRVSLRNSYVSQARTHDCVMRTVTADAAGAVRDFKTSALPRGARYVARTVGMKGVELLPVVGDFLDAGVDYYEKQQIAAGIARMESRLRRAQANAITRC